MESGRPRPRLIHRHRVREESEQRPHVRFLMPDVVVLHCR